MPDTPITIGDKIKYHRERLGFTQEDVANKLHTKPQNIYKYEKGIIENIPLTNIVAMAELFEISPAELTGWGNPFVARREDPFEKDMEATLAEDFTFTECEKQLILKYRENTHLHDKINSLLGIDPQKVDKDNTYVYTKVISNNSAKSDTLKVASPTGSRYKTRRFFWDDDK